MLSADVQYNIYTRGGVVADDDYVQEVVLVMTSGFNCQGEALEKLGWCQMDALETAWSAICKSIGQCNILLNSWNVCSWCIKCNLNSALLQRNGFVGQRCVQQVWIGISGSPEALTTDVIHLARRIHMCAFTHFGEGFLLLCKCFWDCNYTKYRIKKEMDYLCLMNYDGKFQLRSWL